MPTEQDLEQALVAAGRGKWSQPGLPHKGWSCVDIEDLGEPSAVCGMCETQAIRYVHHMTHPEYAGTMEVGCVCAGHLEGSLVAARGREAQMKSRVAKRERWLTRRWRTSAKGNPSLKAEGRRITVYRRATGWAFTVGYPDGTVQHARRNFLTVDQAKLAAFDAITRRLAEQEGASSP